MKYILIFFLCLRVINSANEITVAVSFSMSDKAIQQLYKSVTKAGGILVIRGLYKNSFKETAKKLHELKIALQVDPDFFKKFNITCVPTFVMEKNKKTSMLSGHITFKKAMEILSEDLEDKS
jgi:type-F conjugative transfer system pilin assembly protein TrbC